MKKLFGDSNNAYRSYLHIKQKGIIILDYLIIKGSIKNTGEKNVTQCLINLIKYDENNVIISMDKIKVLGDILPGKSRTIHSMTAWPKSAKAYNLIIEEVRVKQ